MEASWPAEGGAAETLEIDPERSVAGDLKGPFFVPAPFYILF
jgi:hypothetical protein